MASGAKGESGLVDVFASQQESEVMVVHGLLESAGIDSAVISTEAQDVLAGVGGMVIRVNPEQAEAAREIIEEYKNAPELEEDDDEEGTEEEQEP